MTFLAILLALYYVLLTVVCIYAATKGGRYERIVASLYFVASVAALLVTTFMKNSAPLAPFSVIDAGLWLGLVWVLWRFRPIWLIAAVVAQAIMVAFDVLQLAGAHAGLMPYLHFVHFLSYFQLLCLAFGVAWRQFGPPKAPPPHAVAVKFKYTEKA